MKKIIFGGLLTLSGVILYGIGVFNYVYIDDLVFSLNKFFGILFIIVGLAFSMLGLK